MALYISSTLSVSRKEKLDCHEMAKYLSKAGIMTSITAKYSLLNQELDKLDVG